MKIFILCALFLNIAFTSDLEKRTPKEISEATGIPVCAIIQSIRLKDDIIDLGKNDKFMHCALSCQIALRCGGYQSLSVGILKELWDLITPGDADIEDIKADIAGINLVLNNQANNDNQCINICDDLYKGDL